MKACCRRLRTFVFLTIVLFHLRLANAEQTKIGVIVPLTGALAEYGIAVRNGVELALHETEAPLSIVWEDSQSETTLAVSAFNRLQSGGAELVIVWGTTATEAVASLAERYRLPLLAVSVSPSVSLKRAYIVRTVAPADRIVLPLTEHLRESNVKHVVLLKTEWSYTEELAQALREQLPGIRLAERSFNRAERDFRTTILRIKAEQPDTVGVFLGVGQTSAFFRQAEQLGLQARIFGSDFFSSEKEIEDSGPLIEGAVFPHHATCEAFTKVYFERFHNETHLPYAVNAFDITRLLVKLAFSGTGNNLFENLQAVGQQIGICGTFTFENSSRYGKHFNYPVGLYKVQGGKVARVR